MCHTHIRHIRYLLACTIALWVRLTDIIPNQIHSNSYQIVFVGFEWYIFQCKSSSQRVLVALVFKTIYELIQIKINTNRHVEIDKYKWTFMPELWAEWKCRGIWDGADKEEDDARAMLTGISIEIHKFENLTASDIDLSDSHMYSG